MEIVLGDVNGDGNANLLDVQPFIELISLAGFQVEADINQDGVVDPICGPLPVANVEAIRRGVNPSTRQPFGRYCQSR